MGQVTAGNQEDIRIGYGGKGNTAKYADTVNNTARSAEVEPPGLGSKCGKRVDRLSDF